MSTPSADPSLALSLVDDVPLRVQRRLGLAPARGIGAGRRAVFFALLTWLPLVIWAAYAGRMLPGTVEEPLLRHFGVHVRFLLAVPALILGEAVAHRMTTRLIPYFLISGVVPPAQRDAFVAVTRGVARLRDRALPWLLIGALIVAWTVLAPATTASEAGHEASWASSGDAGQFGFGGWWFLYVSRPVFAVLLAAWVWRLALAFVLLKRIAALDLSIVPTHPDGAGGLGFLKDLPKAFGLPAFAASAVVASRLAHDVLLHDVSLASLKTVLAGFVVLTVLLCVAPLLAVAGRLAAAKRRGLLEYGALVGEHGRLVRRRWILNEKVPAEATLLHAPEIGPVADTIALYDAVGRMKPVPFGKSTVLGILVPTLVPILVLLSTQMPFKEVLKKIAGALL
jgi:hypothetical protein